MASSEMNGAMLLASWRVQPAGLYFLLPRYHQCPPFLRLLQFLLFHRFLRFPLFRLWIGRS
jgi:hypothetical protein